MTDQAPVTKPAGKCQQLHALWAEAGDGELLSRAFAVELGVAAGFNPATCRTQYQVMRARLATVVEPTPE